MRYKCSLCGKYDYKHWKRHWRTHHGIESGLELARDESPSAPWCDNWYEVLVYDAAPINPRIIKGFKEKNEGENKGGRWQKRYKSADVMAMSEFVPARISRNLQLDPSNVQDQ